jgi:hypothetical protein
MKEIWLEPGEGVVIRAKMLEFGVVEIHPPEPEEEDESIFLTIDGVEFWRSGDGTHCWFQSDLDVCNDGTGPTHGDPTVNPKHETAYYSGSKTGTKCLNADVDRYIVVPPQIRAKLPGVVMGCRGRVTNLQTGVVEEGVVGEIGPDYTSGEAAYCLAKLINSQVEHNSGDKERVYLYELWPGVPATDGEFTYKLQPA